MKLGKKSTLISAYATLFTVAGGLLAYDAHSRRAPLAKAVAVSAEETAPPTMALAAVKARPLDGKPFTLK